MLEIPQRAWYALIAGLVVVALAVVAINIMTGSKESPPPVDPGTAPTPEIVRQTSETTGEAPQPVAKPDSADDSSESASAVARGFAEEMTSWKTTDERPGTWTERAAQYTTSDYAEVLSNTFDTGDGGLNWLAYQRRGSDHISTAYEVEELVYDKGKEAAYIVRVETTEGSAQPIRQAIDVHLVFTKDGWRVDLGLLIPEHGEIPEDEL